MKRETIAKRWASALLLIDIEQGGRGALADEIKRAADAYEASGELRDTLRNPQIPSASRRRIWQGIIQRLGLSPMVRNTLELMEQKDRLEHLPMVADIFRKLVDEKNGIIRGEVVSVKPLDLSARQKLKNALEKITTKKVELEYSEEKELLGGFIVRLGSLTLDGSLGGVLNRLAASGGMNQTQGRSADQ